MKTRASVLASLLLASCAGVDDGSVAEDEAAASAIDVPVGEPSNVPPPLGPTTVPEMASCFITFSNALSLLLLPNVAKDTFALEPWWVDPCGFERTAVRVEPIFPYTHYHLSFEDETIDCYDSETFGFGREVGDDCVPPDAYYLEPRYLQTHEPQQEVRIWVSQRNLSIWFNLKGLRVRDGGSARVRYRYEGSNVWHTVNAGPGFTSFGRQLHKVAEVRVRALDTGSGEVLSLDNIMVDVPKLY